MILRSSTVAAPSRAGANFTHRVISGTAQLTISNGLVRVLALVTMPVLTRLLSPETYGLAALVTTIISLASVIALAGIDTTYLRVYHSSQSPNGIGAENFCWRFSMLNSILVATLAAIAWRFSSDSVDPGHRFAILVAAGIVLSVASTMAQGRALIMPKHRALAFATVAAGVVAAVASIGLAEWRGDALALVLPLLLGYLVPVLMLGVPPVRQLARRSPLSWSEGAGLVKIGLAGVVTAPMYWLLTASDRWFLLHFHGPQAVGVYSIGYSVGMVGMVVNTAAMSVWQPETTREYEDDPLRARFTLGKLMSRLIAAMAIIWLATVAAGGDIVRWLANERFHDAADYVSYIAGGVFFYGLLRLGTTGLFVAKQLKWAALWWLAGGVVCAALNFVLVPRYAGVGAAVTQTISFAFIAVGILSTAQVKFRLQLDVLRLAGIIVVAVAAGVWMAPAWHPVAVLSLLMKLPVGLAIALAIFVIMAPQWCLKRVEHLRQRALD